MSTTTTKISWCDRTWNPTRGCSRVSPGCVHCYAELIALRFSRDDLAFHGFARRDARGKAQWTGKVELMRDALTEPLSWRKPARIFANSMSDLFHEELNNDKIAAVFGVMAAAPQHTFQVLTKRAKRMADWHAWLKHAAATVNGGRGMSMAAYCLCQAQLHTGDAPKLARDVDRIFALKWPLRNVWLGVSVEDQQRADERIPELLRTPAAIRFLSCEPMIESVDLGDALDEEGYESGGPEGWVTTREHGIDWVIIGGESGPGARAFDIHWARSLVAQCRKAGVAPFVKQLGTVAFDSDKPEGQFTSFEHWCNKAKSWIGGTGALCVDAKGRVLLVGKDFMRSRDEGAFPVRFCARLPRPDKKGGVMESWPSDLRVREFPKEAP
ncbi:MAG: DUF5131 family protein [Polyangiales bacterium]